MKKISVLLLLFLGSFSLWAQDMDDTYYRRDNHLKRNWINLGIHTGAYGVAFAGIYMLGTNSADVGDGAFWGGLALTTTGIVGITIPAISISTQRNTVLKYADHNTTRYKVSRVSKGMRWGAVGLAAVGCGALFFAHQHRESVAVPLLISSGVLYTGSLFTYAIGAQIDESQRKKEVSLSFSPCVIPHEKRAGVMIGVAF